MKEVFIEAEIQLVQFEAVDVITTSAVQWDDEPWSDELDSDLWG